MTRVFLPALLGLAFSATALLATALNAQDWDDTETGDAAMAERYVQWAQETIGRGEWPLAEEALERAADFSDVSSDLSYLLALARAHLDRPRRTVLEALREALAFDHWNAYSATQARLLEAETLVAIRAYGEALAALDQAGESEKEICLRALACQGLGDSRGFNQAAREALDRYPRSPEPMRIVFSYATNRIPDAAERELISLCLRRLPFLLEADPELAFLAVPFVRDVDEARRLLSAYRAIGGANPAALPGALNLGIIDESRATEELFAEPALDKALAEKVWGLLRSAEGRERFARKLSAFTGFITEDTDRDGHSESQAGYQDGMLQSYAYDADQDLQPELEVFFAAGLPTRAEIAAAQDEGDAGGLTGRPRVFLEWEQYPAVLRAELEGVAYIPRPGEFFFRPLEFRDLLGSSLLYPERGFMPRISRRILVSSALALERPGREIPGSVERVELNAGVPRRSREYLHGALVADTEYLLGRPLIQWIDMDLDGRMETVRRFRQAGPELDLDLDYAGSLASSESDWDGDGIYEYGETYEGDRVIRAWDMDKDGVREHTEGGVRSW